MIWEDNWIISNYRSFHSWSEMKDTYNYIFKTALSRNQFKNHVHELGLKLGDYFYSLDEDEFLKERYPKLSPNELAEEFNKTFFKNKSYKQLRQRAYKLGLKKSDKYICERQIRAGKSRAVHVGSISRNSDGYYRVKMKDGTWKSLAKVKYEEYHGVSVGDNECIIYLDGNSDNLSRDNLEVITASEMSLINNNLRIDRSCKPLTETAIKWVRLYSALKKEYPNLKAELNKLEY